MLARVLLARQQGDLPMPAHAVSLTDEGGGDSDCMFPFPMQQALAAAGGTELHDCRGRSKHQHQQRATSSAEISFSFTFLSRVHPPPFPWRFLSRAWVRRPIHGCMCQPLRTSSTYTYTYTSLILIKSAVALPQLLPYRLPGLPPSPPPPVY